MELHDDGGTNPYIHVKERNTVFTDGSSNTIAETIE